MEEMCKIQAVYQVGPYLLMPQLKNQASPLLGGSPKARDPHPMNSVQQDPFRSFSVLSTSYVFTSWEDASIKQNLSNREPAETTRWRTPATQGCGGNRSYSSHTSPMMLVVGGMLILERIMKSIKAQTETLHPLLHQSCSTQKIMQPLQHELRQSTRCDLLPVSKILSTVLLPITKMKKQWESQLW